MIEARVRRRFAATRPQVPLVASVFEVLGPLKTRASGENATKAAMGHGAASAAAAAACRQRLRQCRRCRTGIDLALQRAAAKLAPMHRARRATLIRVGRALAGAPLVLSAAAAAARRGVSGEAIRVGVLHSLSGTMAISEKAVVEATLLAIDELNAEGGLLGRPVSALVRDGESNPLVFAREADHLITRAQVCAVFGGWTSASRKTMKPVFERERHLLFYPVQYEGMERSPAIVYTGAAPNQQIIPAIKWSSDRLGKRFYVVGSDYVFPRAASWVIADQIGALRGELVGERYLLLGETEVGAVIDDIRRLKPQVVLNTVNGDTNIALFRALTEAGLDAQRLPVLSFSIAEPELAVMGAKDLTGHYAVWNYFQSVDEPANARFVAAFRARYGAARVLSDPMEAAYFGVKLWAQAVRRAGTEQVGAVREAVTQRVVAAPGGPVYVDPSNRHVWKTVRVGRVRGDGQFDIVWQSAKPIRPQPYPPSRAPADWDQAVEQLYRGWGGRWANPATPRASGVALQTAPAEPRPVVR
jgi:urea transport system substrate-binding protein